MDMTYMIDLVQLQAIFQISAKMITFNRKQSDSYDMWEFRPFVS